jgi:hypothetical protein
MPPSSGMNNAREHAADEDAHPHRRIGKSTLEPTIPDDRASQSRESRRAGVRDAAGRIESARTEMAVSYLYQSLQNCLHSGLWRGRPAGDCSFYILRPEPAFNRIRPAGNRTYRTGSFSSGEIAAAPFAPQSHGESIVVCRYEEVRLETGPTPSAPFISGRNVKTPGTGVAPVSTAGTPVPQPSQLLILYSSGGGNRHSSDCSLPEVESAVQIRHELQRHELQLDCIPSLD